jgi:ribosomal protein S18 acetylase RimI-like enzyme
MEGMELTLELATLDDAAEIFALKKAVAEDLTEKFGKGHWSSYGSEEGVERSLDSGDLWICRDGGELIAMLRLATKKPWAIDVSYFTPCETALYLTDMAVSPPLQGRGIGRDCMTEAARIAAEHPAQAIRLDAYDHPAGAGAFYAKCGYTEVGRVVFKKTPLVYYESMI